MTDYLTENKLLMEYLRDLKMPSVKEYIEDVEKTANAEQWTYRQFLCKLMEEEVKRRAENRKTQRLCLSYLLKYEKLKALAHCVGSNTAS